MRPAPTAGHDAADRRRRRHRFTSGSRLSPRAGAAPHRHARRRRGTSARLGGMSDSGRPYTTLYCDDSSRASRCSACSSPCGLSSVMRWPPVARGAFVEQERAFARSRAPRSGRTGRSSTMCSATSAPRQRRDDVLRVAVGELDAVGDDRDDHGARRLTLAQAASGFEDRVEQRHAALVIENRRPTASSSRLGSSV